MPARRLLPLSLALLLFALSLAPAAAENWPQWRGPTGDGIVASSGSGKTLPTAWSESAGIRWKVKIPAWGTSTPAIWDDAVYLTTQTDDGDLSALRLDARDGRIVWTTRIGTAETKREAEKRSVQKFHRLHNNASPSPVTDGRTVVVHFGNGDLAALDADGKQLWKRNLQDDYGPYSIWWGHANSPVLYGDLVISVCMQDSLEGTAAERKAVSYVVAHDLRSGQVRWHTPRPTTAEAEQFDSYTTPVFHKLPDGGPASGSTVEMIVMGGNQLDAYDPATGKLRWFLPGLTGGRTITGAVVAGDMVYATRGQRGELLGVKIDAASANAGSQLADASVAFRHKELTPDSACPVVWNDRVYTIADNGIAQCLDAHSGAQLWKERIPGDYKASPIAADGHIYFLNTAGLTTVVAAGDMFQKVSENQLDDETIASPAAAGGVLYLRGREHLYAIEAK
jgi:outer membrane protein assembly factor BamB